MKRDAFRPTKLRPRKSVARAWLRNDPLMRPEGVAGLGEEEEEVRRRGTGGTFERWEMGEEVEGRGGRASVGRATAI
ncbi:hypothetical protein ALC62_07371 [Cyphomyrmex costatus]|uniref:Uncharacterized protein n=1 Tax=Cyphomyrmex costatus TaxID=456900 RepID=A0A195CP65_9HYME|nr:hypothetical protein ALC62_07371 [Cyphomyrmex costatus]